MEAGLLRPAYRLPDMETKVGCYWQYKRAYRLLNLTINQNLRLLIRPCTMPEATNAQVAIASGHDNEENNDHLVQSSDPQHPANLIPELCRKFYTWGWVTGTGGGVSV